MVVWRRTPGSFMILNRVAVLSNIDKGVSDIAAYFEAFFSSYGIWSSAIWYIFITSEYLPSA